MITIEIFHTDYSLRVHEKSVSAAKKKFLSEQSDNRRSKLLSEILDGLSKNKFYWAIEGGPENLGTVTEIAEELSREYHGWAIVCVQNDGECYLFSTDFGKLKVKPL